MGWVMESLKTLVSKGFPNLCEQIREHLAAVLGGYL